MPTKNSLEKLKLQLKTELERSILLEPEDRNFWLENLATLPLNTVQNLLNILHPKNELVDSYIDAALSQDVNQEHLKALQNKIKKIKQEAFKIEEKSETKSEQQTGEDLLGKLDQA
jgi:hypothetical protein